MKTAARAFGNSPDRARSRASVDAQLAARAAPPPLRRKPAPTVDLYGNRPGTLDAQHMRRDNALEAIRAALWRRTDRASGAFDDRWLARDIAAALRGSGYAVPPDLDLHREDTGEVSR
jgi:hypothetical protein